MAGVIANGLIWKRYGWNVGGWRQSPYLIKILDDFLIGVGDKAFRVLGQEGVQECCIRLLAQGLGAGWRAIISEN